LSNFLPVKSSRQNRSRHFGRVVKYSARQKNTPPRERGVAVVKAGGEIAAREIAAYFS
jgi:hypothetical protein